MPQNSEPLWFVSSTFSFNFICHEEIVKKLTNYAIKRLLKKINKKKQRSYFIFLHDNFNNSLSSSNLPTVTKYANVKPIHNKNNKPDKENTLFSC